MGFPGIKDPPPLIEVPDKLRNRKLKSDRQKQRFTRDYLLAITPQVSDAFVRAVMRGLQQNNPSVIRLAGELVALIKTRDGGVNVSVQQNNTSNSLSLGDKEDRVSFEQVVRKREEERRKLLNPTVITIEPPEAE